MRHSIYLVLFTLLLASCVQAGDFSGTYSMPGEFGPVFVVLSQESSGAVSGSLPGGGMALVLAGTADQQGGISGTVSQQGVGMRFEAALDGDLLHFTLIEQDPSGAAQQGVSQTLVFTKHPADLQSSPTVRPGTPPRTVEPGAPPQAGESERRVVINGEKLGGEQLASLERTYNVRIQSGSYWYDKRCGAWGMEGGPASGIIPAGLDTGGPLREDASNGTTAVYINGRRLHAYDLLVLQQLLGTVLPGRYWLDEMGNAGVEGGPAMYNLLQLAAAQQARASGGGSLYRSGLTGIGAGSSGGTSYVMGKDWSVTVGP